MFPLNSPLSVSISVTIICPLIVLGLILCLTFLGFTIAGTFSSPNFSLAILLAHVSIAKPLLDSKLLTNTMFAVIVSSSWLSKKLYLFFTKFVLKSPSMFDINFENSS